MLLAFSALRAEDRVVVFGTKTLDHLLLLVKFGCKDVVAGHPESQEHLAGPADVVWLIGADVLEFSQKALAHDLGSPRLVAIVIGPQDVQRDLKTVLSTLQASGLSKVAILTAADGTVFVATRPASLRLVH